MVWKLLIWPPAIDWHMMVATLSSWLWPGSFAFTMSKVIFRWCSKMIGYTWTIHMSCWLTSMETIRESLGGGGIELTKLGVRCHPWLFGASSASATKGGLPGHWQVCYPDHGGQIQRDPPVMLHVICTKLQIPDARRWGRRPSSASLALQLWNIDGSYCRGAW